MVVPAGMPGPLTANPAVNTAGLAGLVGASCNVVEPIVVAAPEKLSTPDVCGFSRRLPSPLLVTPTAVSTLLMNSLSDVMSERTTSSEVPVAPAWIVPPEIVALPMPLLRMPALVSVSVVPGF